MSHVTTQGVRLDQFFDGRCLSGNGRVSVAHAESDWRRVQQGDAFVCIVGDEDDGHDHAAEAVRRGAAAIVAERPLPVFSVPVFVVEDTRIAYGELCHALADHPCQRIRVIGVVGTQGKSTVAALLESILNAAGSDVGVLSSWKTYDGMTCGPGRQGPLSPSDLAARLARMESAGCTHAVVELTSVDLAQRTTAGLQLDTVVGTCVDSARLDVHQRPQNYRNALRSAFDLLAPEGLAILNADDPTSCRWLATLDAPSLTYGLDADAQITAEIIDRNSCETVFVLTAGCESAAIRTTIVGDHHVSNCLAAATVALAHGLELTTIAAGIEKLQRLPACMERIDCGQDFAVFVDAAESATGLRAALRTARRLAQGRVICVLGDSRSAAADATTVRSVVRKLADVAIVTEDLAELCSEWRTDCDEEIGVHIVADRSDAIAWALAGAELGDVVVIAGSRGGDEPGFGNVEIREAEAAREMLRMRQAPQLRLVG